MGITSVLDWSSTRIPHAEPTSEPHAELYGLGSYVDERKIPDRFTCKDHR